MKGIVLYRSKYGAAKQYAAWLEEATGFDCAEVRNAGIEALKRYDVIILAGGIYASGISVIPFLRKHIDELGKKKIAVFCVGASPFDEDAFAQVRAHNFKGTLQGIPCFYGRGAWDESAMSLTDRTLCRMLQKMVAKKAPASLEPWEKALMCAAGQACDWTDRAFLQPLLDWIEEVC